MTSGKKNKRHLNMNKMTNKFYSWSLETLAEQVCCWQTRHAGVLFTFQHTQHCTVQATKCVSMFHVDFGKLPIKVDQKVHKDSFVTF